MAARRRRPNPQALTQGTLDLDLDPVAVEEVTPVETTAVPTKGRLDDYKSTLMDLSPEEEMYHQDYLARYINKPRLSLSEAGKSLAHDMVYKADVQPFRKFLAELLDIPTTPSEGLETLRGNVVNWSKGTAPQETCITWLIDTMAYWSDPTKPTVSTEGVHESGWLPQAVFNVWELIVARKKRIQEASNIQVPVEEAHYKIIKIMKVASETVIGLHHKDCIQNIYEYFYPCVDWDYLNLELLVSGLTKGCTQLRTAVNRRTKDPDYKMQATMSKERVVILDEAIKMFYVSPAALMSIISTGCVDTITMNEALVHKENRRQEVAGKPRERSLERRLSALERKLNRLENL
jgi:hypothetical protein